MHVSSFPQDDSRDARVPLGDHLLLGPFEAFGARFMLQTPDPALASFLDELYRPLRSSGPEAAIVYSLFPPSRDAEGVLKKGQRVIYTSSRRHPLLGSLVWEINRQVIDGPSRTRLILHAAAAELHGDGVLLPAPMESGKTTLVTGLLDRGFGYLTDEAVAVADDLMVEGYCKPLSIDAGSWRVLAHHEPEVAPSVRPYMADQWQVAVQGFAPVINRSSVRLIVFPRYVAGAQLRFEPLSPASAVRDVFASIFVPEGQPVPLDKVRRVCRLVERVPAARLTYSDLGEACERIIVELAGLDDSRER